MAGGDDTEGAAGAVEVHPVEAIGPDKLPHQGQAVAVVDDLRALAVDVGGAEVNPLRGQFAPVRQDKTPALRVHRHRGGELQSLVGGLEAHVHPRVAGQGKARQGKVEAILHRGRGQHRDHAVDPRRFALRREGRGFAGVVIPGHHQHPAVGVGAADVGVLQGIQGAIHPRGLAVPDGEHPVHQGLLDSGQLLGAPDRRGGNVLIHPRLEHHLVCLQVLLGRP